MPIVKCRTKDGLEVDLEASLQYRVQPSKIYQIYTTYGDEELDVLNRVVLDVISDTSTLYSSNDFFTKRAIIQKKMKDALKSQISERTWHDVVYFQLRSLSLPNAFEKEIQNTEVKGQDIHTATAELTRETVKYVTNYEVAKLAVNATVETAYGNGNKTYYEALAEASTIGDVIERQAEGYKSMKSNLNFGTPEILTYLKNSLVKDYPDGGKMAISMDL